MIISSKQALLISSPQSKQFFMFDPKTTAVMHKYHTQEHLSPPLVYNEYSQQIISQQINKTFLSTWSWNSQQVQTKISMTQNMTCLTCSQDNHFLLGGSISGTLYIWQLPSGILLKKKSIHTTQIKKIFQYKNNHLITISKNDIKIWNMSSIFIEQDNNTPIKMYQSILDIIDSCYCRNIIGILANKCVTLINASLSSFQKELKIYQKIDYQYATTLAISQTKVYVGNGNGNIDIIDLIHSQEQKQQLHFKIQSGSLSFQKQKKIKILKGSKHPVTSLEYLATLAYLISGHSNGQIIIWQNYQIKKSLHLFKTAVTGLTKLIKPKDIKIYQGQKIKTLHKYQLTKDNQPLVIVPAKGEQSFQHEYQPLQAEYDEEEVILERIMKQLQQPQKLLRQEVKALRQQKRQLLQANLHYFKLLAP